MLPLIYGVGTAVPVLVVAFLLAYSARSVGKAYNMLAKIEWWARQITGWVFRAGRRLVFVGVRIRGQLRIKYGPHDLIA